VEAASRRGSARHGLTGPAAVEEQTWSRRTS